jgi:tetratricopeptide (TPR) repeat protein
MHSLSLCMIVKDEEKNLPRALASVRGLADEIVIVDTGSTDRTIEIARAAGARVVEKPFDDDFSQVRNAGLDVATKEWILVLDADEWLTQESLPAIRQALRDRRIAGYYLPFENELGGGRVHRCSMMRLFRRDRAIRFEYCLHEQVLPSLIRFGKRRGMKLAPLPRVTVLHDGYLAANVAARDKDARNHRIYAKQLAKHPDHAYSWYKFGDFLRRFAGRGDEARDALRRAGDLIAAMPPAERADLSFGGEVHALLALDLDRRGDLASALAAVRAGHEAGQPSANLLYVTAHLLLKSGDARGALRAYAKLRAADGKPHAIPPEPGATTTLAFLGMGRALAQLSRRVAALRCFDHALRCDGANAEARIARSRLRLEHGDVAGAAADYSAVLERDPRNHGVRTRLGQLLLHCGEYAAAAEQLERALEDGAEAALVAPRIGQARLALGQLEAALDCFAAAPADPDARIGIAVLEELAAGRDPRGREALRGARPWNRVLDAALARR